MSEDDPRDLPDDCHRRERGLERGNKYVLMQYDV